MSKERSLGTIGDSFRRAEEERAKRDAEKKKTEAPTPPVVSGSETPGRFPPTDPRAGLVGPFYRPPSGETPLDANDAARRDERSDFLPSPFPSDRGVVRPAPIGITTYILSPHGEVAPGFRAPVSVPPLERRPAPEALPPTVEPTPESVGLSAEDERKLGEIRMTLLGFKELKERGIALDEEDVELLKKTLGELQEIVREKGLGIGEHWATFEESEDPHTGRKGLISRAPGRKFMVLDRGSRRPVPGTKCRVRVVRDTAPGERRGTLFVTLVE